MCQYYSEPSHNAGLIYIVLWLPVCLVLGLRRYTKAGELLLFGDEIATPGPGSITVQ